MKTPLQIIAFILLLAGLPAAMREVLALHYGQGLRMRDIGVLLGLSEVAVKQRVSRARRELRQRLPEVSGAHPVPTRPPKNARAVMISPRSPVLASVCPSKRRKLRATMKTSWCHMIPTSPP